jgi:hypothetical protein
MADTFEERTARAEAARAEVTGRLAAAGRSDVRLRDALKFGGDGAVFRARARGQKLVVKWFDRGDPAHTVRSLEGELARVAPRLSAGPFRVNTCLAAYPDQGLALLSEVPGKRLGDALARAGAGSRARLLGQAGGWLVHYGADRAELRSFGPRYWVKRRQERVPTDLSPAQGDLVEEALSTLWEQAADAAGAPVTHAAVHGDFVPINLHVQAGTLWGVDIQGECKMALARDLARFAVWQQIHDARQDDDRLHGVNRADLTALTDGAALAEEDRAVILPFFVGEQLVARLAEVRADPTLADRAALALRRWLDG